MEISKLPYFTARLSTALRVRPRPSLCSRWPIPPRPFSSSPPIAKADPSRQPYIDPSLLQEEEEAPSPSSGSTATSEPHKPSSSTQQLARPRGRLPPVLPKRSKLSRLPLASFRRNQPTVQTRPAAPRTLPPPTIGAGHGSESHLFHYLHVVSTKHNTHLTLSNPDRNSIISVSCGNMGYRKSHRGTYDAAFHLGAYMMNRIQHQGLLASISNLELVFRGWGPGREAMSRIMLGVEGARLKGLVRRVTDKTKIKIKGGPRSPKPRRLG